MRTRIAFAGLLGLAVVSHHASAAGRRWDYFEAPVKVLEVYHDKHGEGNFISGIELSDKQDRYSVVCKSRTEQGLPDEATITRWSDGFIDTAHKSPKRYLRDPRGTPYTLLQWSEACLRAKLLN